jgi:hypothetical protein
MLQHPEPVNKKVVDNPLARIHSPRVPKKERPAIRVTEKPLIILPTNTGVSSGPNAMLTNYPGAVEGLLNMVHVGGPKDGTWTKMEGIKDMTDDGQYRREFVRWETKWYPVLIHESLPTSELMRYLVCGYGAKKPGQKYEGVSRSEPGRRKFDLES